MKTVNEAPQDETRSSKTLQKQMDIIQMQQTTDGIIDAMCREGYSL